MAVNPYRVKIGLGVLKAYSSNSNYLSTTGSTATRGDFFFNSDKLRYEYYDGASWRALTIRTNRAVVKAIDLVSVAVPSGPQTVDGISCVVGNLVLLTLTPTKGVYRVEAGTWSLQTEYLTDPSGSPYKGDLVFVQESGSTNALTSWVWDGSAWVQHGLPTGTTTSATLRWNGTNWIENIDVQTLANVIFTKNNAVADASAAQDLSIFAGSKTAGTGNGGNLVLTGGSSFGGLDGKIIIDGRVLEFGAQGQLSVDPSSPAASQVYYNTTSNKLKYYNGTSWNFLYDGAVTSSGTPVAGQISIFTAAQDIKGDANFTIDTVAGVLKLGSGEYTILSSTAIADATSNAVLFTVAHASFRHLVVDFSLSRGTTKYATGRLLVVHDGVSAYIVDDRVESVASGITFSADISGANLRVLYSSTATGESGTFKWMARRWL